MPPAADAACYPCLPTDVLSLRGLAYILALRQNFNYSDSITGGVCFANFLKDAGIDADYVDELEWKLENAATCVLASFYRTVCQFDVLGDVVESGLLDVLFTEEEYTAFPTTEYYHGELGFTGREAVADAFVQRPGLLAAILARWTATKGGCKALPERARKVLGNFLQLVARNLNPYQGTFCAALDNGHATHYLGVVADVVGPACLTLANLQAVKPMGSLFDDIPLKDAVWYALYISKKLAYVSGCHRRSPTLCTPPHSTPHLGAAIQPMFDERPNHYRNLRTSIGSRRTVSIWLPSTARRWAWLWPRLGAATCLTCTGALKSMKSMVRAHGSPRPAPPHLTTSPASTPQLLRCSNSWPT